MILPRSVHQLLLLVAVFIHFYVAYYVDRSISLFVIASFGFLWTIFLIWWADLKINLKQIIAVGMVFRFIYLLAIPELSDDVFRYIWDGKLTLERVSVYAQLPSEFLSSSPDWQAWYKQLNSPNYYSVYPPVAQFFFAASVWLGGGTVLDSIVALRGFVLLAELGTVIIISKVLNRWQLSSRNLMLYAFNPLVIVEFSGSLHTEAFMVFFLVAGFWLLTSEKQLLSAGAIGLSIGAKLLPLMFLPFFIKRLGWKKAAIYFGVVAFTVGLVFAPFWSPQLLPNIQSSVRLYFANFEFNASIYYLIREVGFWVKGYNIIADTAVWLPRIVLGLILLMALRDKGRTIVSLPKWMMFAWFVYYAFSTTVNPWYIAVLSVFLPFVKYRFALVWMMLIPLSYYAFGNPEFDENTALLFLQYVPVYGWFLFEFGAFKPIQKWWALKRAKVKEERLLPFLDEGQSVLEVGAGNGALSKLLSENGITVAAIDIEDKSLFDEVSIQVCDGEKFPFKESQFDVCQMITMLHHTSNAEQLIQEAKRVSKRIIIMEDVYESAFQKYVTWIADSLVNWEFYGHPHTNRTDVEWKALFERNGLMLKKAEHYRFLLFFKQVMYVLESD